MQTSESKFTGLDVDIINYIREARNTIAKQLLHDQTLKVYLAERHNLSDVSLVKLEFIKRALQQLLIAPVDLEHYGRLFLEMKKSGVPFLLENNEPLFYSDIETAIKNYVY
ncbi:MAG TPA: hypothetical protein VIN08_01265 [Ohtaekwangia sp.]|uniref:hypothetical protein n=1 Tax=Ohtaekwangia sp. TaxID=2066019 RepID=UPI002F926813